MKYPEGQTVKIGDLVWFNEGINTGRVVKILDDESLFEKHGVDEIGVFLCFDLSGLSKTDDIFNAYSLFSDEGIGLLSHEEEETINKIHEMLLSTVLKVDNEVSYRVSRRPRPIGDGKWEHCWLIMPGILKDKCYLFEEKSSELIEVPSDWAIQS